jgi:hypothetical protein
MDGPLGLSLLLAKFKTDTLSIGLLHESGN